MIQIVGTDCARGAVGPHTHMVCVSDTPATEGHFIGRSLSASTLTLLSLSFAAKQVRLIHTHTHLCLLNAQIDIPVV